MVPRVLVADDEVAIADLVSSVLLDAGFDVLRFYDGASALEAVRRELPDLVLLDVMMPGLDGREITRRLKEGKATSRIPVVLFSALSLDLDSTLADAFIPKPFDLDLLVDQASRLTRSA
jgi:CheY-like chemotaxis protein